VLYKLLYCTATARCHLRKDEVRRLAAPVLILFSFLNKSILDQGWAEFRRQLEYKQAWRGGDVSAENRQTQVRFACVDCGYENNADMVGAINILAAGHAVLACGGTVQSGCPAKQEPAEATMQEFALV
jgi:putative transposase